MGILEQKQLAKQQELEEINRAAENISLRIQDTLKTEPLFPVVAQPVIGEAHIADDDDDDDEEQRDETVAASASSTTNPESGITAPATPIPVSPREVLVTATPEQAEIELTDSSYPWSPFVDLQPRSVYVDENIQPSFTCTAGFLLPSLLGGTTTTAATAAAVTQTPPRRQHYPTPPQTEILSPSPSMMIDFSTGMSGHRGLSNTAKASPDGTGGAGNYTRNIRHMAEHRGVTFHRTSPQKQPLRHQQQNAVSPSQS